MEQQRAATLTDWRATETRRDLFQRFYSFQLRHRSHPGGVYYVLPYLADHLGWDSEQRAWAAWINGNTQNPVTTLMLMEAGDRPAKADAMLNWYSDHREQLAWDTDRRYHRRAFLDATLGYLAITEGSGARYWRQHARGGWAAQWAAARALPTMGRLSAWSYLEYLRLLGVGVVDADTLMLTDLPGSRSHRNGLALVAGQEQLMWWKRNPGSSAALYTPEVLAWLTMFGESLLAEAQTRNPGHPDVGYLTLESALCTFKSWHIPNRRYSGVYNDMLYDRLRLAESRHGCRFGLIWDARKAALPYQLRMEHNVKDPGCVPVKQNHFLETGQPVVLGWFDDVIPLSDFDLQMEAGKYADQRKYP